MDESVNLLAEARSRVEPDVSTTNRSEEARGAPVQK